MQKKNNDVIDTNPSNPARQLYDESLTKVSDEADNLETIREILFGEQSREAEKRRHDTHHALQVNITELKQETRDQFEFLSAEVNKLYELINNENEGRLIDKKASSQQLSQLQDSLEITKTQQQLESNKLQKQILKESNKLERQATIRHEELSLKLEQASLDLKSDKADKGDLAQMLKGMAEQLLDASKK